MIRQKFCQPPVVGDRSKMKGSAAKFIDCIDLYSVEKEVPYNSEGVKLIKADQGEACSSLHIGSMNIAPLLE